MKAVAIIAGNRRVIEAPKGQEVSIVDMLKAIIRNAPEGHNFKILKAS